MFLSAISTNTNLFQVFESIWDSLKSTHDHILEYINSLTDYFNLLGDIKNGATSILQWFINGANNTRSLPMMYIVIVMFVVTGFIFIAVDFIRDVL